MGKKILLITFLSLSFIGNSQNILLDWVLGGFVRPEKTHPIITLNPASRFDCPRWGKTMGREKSDVFNSAATVKGNRIYVLYRAEDNSENGIGKRTSRVGLAESIDGIQIRYRNTPVMFPDSDNMKEYEWHGGCEDPCVTMTKDGLYVMAYTAWNRETAYLCIATSRNLITWKKHCLAFTKANNGRFKYDFCKSSSIILAMKDGKQALTKIEGKYFMYWGEYTAYIATFDNLIDWSQILDGRSELAIVIRSCLGYFDLALTECAPLAVLTDKELVLLYNGKSQIDDCKQEKRFTVGTYCAGRILTNLKNSMKTLQHLDVLFSSRYPLLKRVDSTWTGLFSLKA